MPGDRGETARAATSRFAIREGEIVGVAGVAGNGQRELAEAISGMRDVRGRDASASAADACAAATRARRSSRASRTFPRTGSGPGLAPSLSVTSNVVHQDVPDGARCRAGRCSLCGGCATRRSGSSARYDVKTPGPETPVRNLSGGNLQKLVLGREFADEPLVLVVAQPTRGLDVGAIETVHAYLRDAAGEGRRRSCS